MTQLFLKISLCLFLFNNIHAQTSLPIGQRMQTEQFAAIDQLLDQYQEELNIPAISIGILHGTDRTFINKGVYQRQQARQIDENAVFQIASLGKSMVGIIFKELAAAGKIDLNASISTYLPADYTPKTRQKLRPITVRDLLHHRSGLQRESKIMHRKRKGNDPFLYEYTAADFKTDLEKVKLKAKAGEKYIYSNFGYALLGYLAEIVSQKSYAELLQLYITDKYGLERTGMSNPFEKDLVTPYRKGNRNTPTQTWTMGKLAPPSAVYSTTADLLQLMSQQIKVYENDAKNDPLFLTNDLRTEQNDRYGYGLADATQGYFAHAGDMDGYGAVYWFRPQSQFGFVILTSSGGDWVDEFTMEVNRIITSSTN